MSLTRLLALILKELLAVMRDPKGRIVLIAPPVMQLLIFSTAATLEVRNVDVMVLDQDHGHWSEELTARIAGAPTVKRVLPADSPDMLRRAIEERSVIAGVWIGSDFTRRVTAGRPATVQVILDGRRSNASQILASYLGEIATRLSLETPLGTQITGQLITVEPRNWFNANLADKWFMVPNLIASIALLVGLIVTALSIARERELGTFDQLMVSPLRVHEILIGKVVPPMIIGLGHITLFILAALLIFHVPLRGSLGLLYGSAVFYLAAVVGIGLFISALSMTQQQAILGAFLFLVPAMLLSGFATPVENIPSWLQPLCDINPLRYFLVVVRGVFLKDIGVDEVIRQTIPIALIAAVALTAAAWLFRRRME
ncbi:ABC transporter permease [Acuticoccus mangrovi]|uniref:ABC transporter permease n=1 Tax=Acuticoccus mangrovi TaxID=2796142 RepID=A0A934INW0_9HYPH|nr:ABC transporter permease [Acuticoccus mangrovi]MBJ3774864.1 ABC transporter permease [Acuticoccus mangrovi]